MEHKGKLELTWVGKYDDKVIEPRILMEDREKSYGDPRSENMLIHGDNLVALQALQQDFYGSIKCIYIDPPYNTGSAFEHYDDNLEHSIWLNLMRKRLVLLRELLSEEGTIWIQIDDEEQAYLKVLCDEVFGRGNFVNMISVNMKNIAGASGGGEDKRLKKNCEYILIYAKDYTLLPLFNGPYVYTEMSELIQQYLDEGKSWKYTSVLVNPGKKEYIGSTVDGVGNEIKVYRRVGVQTMSVNQLAKKEGLTTKDAYRKHGINVFRTTNAQTSIRTRIIDYRRENDIHDQYLSIEYAQILEVDDALNTLACMLLDSISELSYEDADFIIDVVEQYLAQIEGDEEDKRKIVRRYASLIVSDIRKQIFEHTERKTEDIHIVQKDLILFRKFVKNVKKDGRVRFDKPFTDKSNIKKYLFTGYKKAYYTENAFDSDTERLFSIILEEDPDVIRWIKPPLNQLGLFWQAGQQYNPDFLVETTSGKFMVEVKASNEVTADDVVAKAREGIKWCHFASTADPDHKVWEYRLISDDNIKLGNTCKYTLGTAHRVEEG